MDQNQQPKKVEYICEGTCGAHISEEQYNGGLHVCGTPTCTHYGQPFKKVEINQTENLQPA